MNFLNLLFDKVVEFCFKMVVLFVINSVSVEAVIVVINMIKNSLNCCFKKILFFYFYIIIIDECLFVNFKCEVFFFFVYLNLCFFFNIC